MINTQQIKTINQLLEKQGLKSTWADILFSRIKSNGEKFDYLLQESFFNNATPLDYDLLRGLSIGEISVLYEYSLAHIDKDKRKDEGQYFTPDDVSQFMSRKAVEFPNGVWVDPCSGIGNLSYWLVNSQKDKESFLLNNMFLIDKDELALFIARVLFTLEFQNKESNLFFLLKDKFIVNDFLMEDNLPHFDYAILNPPYSSTEENFRFESSKTKNTYAYFLEKVIKTTRGFISITPQTFTHAESYKEIRFLLKTHCSDLSIYCFDNVPANVFKGYKFGSKNTNKANSTRAAIIVAQKGNSSLNLHITPLLRWRSTERERLFNNADSFLTKINSANGVFPKVSKELINLYNLIVDYPQKLGYIVSSKKTEYELQIPSTPRYFISALRKPVERTSFRVIYLKNKKDFDLVYLLLNSSYMYWWWRINDGGMTISEKTLMSLPIPSNLEISDDLVKQLERSEQTNKVFKKNAGKLNENVKHDSTLVMAINQTLFPEHASQLIKVHENSVFEGDINE